MNPDDLPFLRGLLPITAPADATRIPDPRPAQDSIGFKSGVRPRVERSMILDGDLDTAQGWLNELINPFRQGVQARQMLGRAITDMRHGRVKEAALNAGGVAMAAVPAARGARTGWKAAKAARPVAYVPRAAPADPIEQLLTEPSIGWDRMSAYQRRTAGAPSSATKLPERWAVVTADNPGGTPAPAAANAEASRRLEARIRELGHRPHRTTGRYRDEETGELLSERGFFLPKMKASEAEALGREFGQNGVLTHRGYHNLNESTVHPAAAVADATDVPFTQIEGGARFASDLDFAKKLPRAVPELESTWRRMSRADAPPVPKVKTIDASAAERMAKIYEDLPVHDPNAAPAYRALVDEVNAQFDDLTQQGFTFEFVDVDPYPGGSAEMVADVARNRRLKVFKTNDENPHPFLSKEENDRFRAVHDALAHAGGGNQFGPVGEENAYRIHAQTLSPLARRALATETRGQNSWVNFGPNKHLPPKERPFAMQKAALWPDEFTGDYGSFPKP